MLLGVDGGVDLQDHGCVVKRTGECRALSNKLGEQRGVFCDYGRNLSARYAVVEWEQLDGFSASADGLRWSFCVAVADRCDVVVFG